MSRPITWTLLFVRSDAGLTDSFHGFPMALMAEELARQNVPQKLGGWLGLGKLNPAGITPITVASRSLTVMCLPTISGEEWNSDSQNW